MSLMVSISGIRGVVGESLTPKEIVRYAAAFGAYCKKKTSGKSAVVVGMDGRITGRIVADLAMSTLLAGGVDVRWLGICPTPTVALATERTDAAGGISITASHNPIEWNGLKFMASSGMFLDGEENREFWDIADRTPPQFAGWNHIGKRTDDPAWVQRHIDAVLDLPLLRVEAVRKRKFKVVLDAVNAAGGTIVPILLASLGCDVIPMNCDVAGVFAHTPEPVPENLTDLGGRVRREHADLGIAVDPDVDRLVLINENGEPYGEEYTVASAVRFVLGRTQAASPAGKQTVVVNLSTTRAVEDIAAGYGAQTVRTPVGEINVARRMKDIGSVIGGEGSGGVILPELHYGRDAIVGIALILQLLAESGGTLSDLKKSLPAYSIAKGKIALKRGTPDALLERMKGSVPPGAQVNTDDGLRIDFPEYWLHLRKSNTEPIIRVIAEARSMGQARSLVAETSSKLTQLSEGQ
jgi:phosphomannomutase